MNKSIYDYIPAEETNFTLPITVEENYDWNFREQVRTAVLYKSSIFLGGPDENKPFKNIIRPNLNLQYRAEGFDVKDIHLYVDDSYKYFKSFLLRKYHEEWARKNNLDTFIDDLVQSFVDFGGALVKRTSNIRPEVVPLQRIAFCDQTDILSGPICEKLFYSPEELRAETDKGWENVDEVITLAMDSKNVVRGRKAKTPGKYIEIYELHGEFPRYWLYDYDKDGYPMGDYYDEESDEAELVKQVHVCTFYQRDDGTKGGITLFKGIEKDNRYKFISRDEIHGRALGTGGVEELQEAQIWTNYGMIRMKELLDGAAKVIHWTDDEKFANRNSTLDLEQGEILVGRQGSTFKQIDTVPRQLPQFDNWDKDWEALGRITSAATESILGERPAAGTPFKLQELITAESHSLHEFRKGRLASFVDEIYRDWIIPKLSKSLTSDKEFLAELDPDEINEVLNGLISCEVNRVIRKMLFEDNVLPDARVIEDLRGRIRQSFSKKGQAHFLELLANELKDAPISVKINIVGKQKDLAGQVDKMVNVFRTILANLPAIQQNPALAKTFNEILEKSNLSPIDFSGLFNYPAQQTPAEGAKPLQKLGESRPLAEKLTT